MKDALDRQIRAGLDARDFEGDEFEACAVDLLRRDFPGLVPVPGGKDAGMDGALPDGETFLVCTKGDVDRNLNKSLDSHLKAGGLRRKVLLATCQKITPPGRRKLEDLAREKGFHLVQIFEQEAIAQRLRENPYWCKRLLGLSGALSLLSPVPVSRRPRPEIPLIGRERDLEWLQNTSGDRVVIGEPGAGKTCLLERFVGEGKALFLVDSNLAELGNELREKKPEHVIVDDAHVDPPLLAKLRQRREEIQGDFSILASTWPGERNEEAVFESLGILNPSDPTKVHKLELLAREEILEIYRSLGVRARDDVMRWLVTSAANRPGLAVTLGQLCLEGAWEVVVRGEALSQAVLAPMRRMVGDEAIDILAAFSMGGDTGMELEAVGQFLEMPLHVLRRKTADLAAGGVLAGGRNNRLIVIPALLRRPLLRQVFFREVATRPFEDLLSRASNLEDAIHEIIVATHGGGLSWATLQELILRSHASGTWSIYARKGRSEARWSLEQYPGSMAEIGDALLDIIPETAVQRLLESSGRAQPSFQVDPALSCLAHWVRDIRVLEIGPSEVIRRRRVLASQAREFLLAGGGRETGIDAICRALSPALGGSTQDPGAGTTITLKTTLLPAGVLREMTSIWREVRDAIGKIDRVAWGHLSSILWLWLHPTSAAMTTNLPEEVSASMYSVAAEIIQDLVPLAQGSPGATAGLMRLAEPVGIQLDLELDPIFELLYPAKYIAVENRREIREAIQQLAEEWSIREPEAVAKDLARYENEAQTIHFPRPGLGRELGEALASRVAFPETWLAAFLDETSGSDFVEPLMVRTVSERRSGWMRLVERSFGSRSYAWDATWVVLKDPEPPVHLLDLALKEAERFPQLVESLCLRREAPLSTLKCLLLHSDQNVSLAAAIGEWGPVSEKAARPEVSVEWRRAIIRAKSSESEDAPSDVSLQYWLGVLLGGDPALAMEWLVFRLREDPPSYIGGSSSFVQAIQSLCHEQRIQLIDALEAGKVPRGLFLPLVVGRDLILYQSLLEREDLREHHLEPLAAVPDNAWLEMAIRALNAGHDPEEVARSSFDVSEVISGSGLEYWKRWDDGFSAFESHHRLDVREVARHGRGMAGFHLEHAKRRQELVRLYGF